MPGRKNRPRAGPRARRAQPAADPDVVRRLGGRQLTPAERRRWLVLARNVGLSDRNAPATDEDDAPT